MIVRSKYNIIGRGTIFAISLKDNGIGRTISNVKELKGKIIEVEDKSYEIRGTELMIPLSDIIGLLVREILP
jgi:hypothetical protein